MFLYNTIFCAWFIIYLFSLFYIQFHLAPWLSIMLEPQGGCTSFAGSDSFLMQLYDIHDPCTTSGGGGYNLEFMSRIAGSKITW
jgi:hypothetical protein